MPRWVVVALIETGRLVRYVYFLRFSLMLWLFAPLLVLLNGSPNRSEPIGDTDIAAYPLRSFLSGIVTPEQALREELAQGELSRPSRAGAESLLGVLDRLRESLDQPVELLLARILDETDYARELGEPGEEGTEERRANVEELLAGAAQFGYMLLFSYSFFFDGLTGLTITLGAIGTLALLMVTTAKVKWSEKFGKNLTPPVMPHAAVS